MSTIADISDVLLNLGLSDSVTEEERAIASVSIKRAEGAVIRFLKYNPVQRSRTEFYPQQDTANSATNSIWEVNESTAYQRFINTTVSTELQVQHLPIRSITELYIDYDGRFGQRSGSFSNETLKTSGEDYWINCEGLDNAGNAICRDGIIRSQGLWTVTPGSVKVIYVAGYTEDEFRGNKTLVNATPIFEAVVDEAVRRAKKVFVQKKQTGSGWAAGPITSESLGDYSYSVDGSSLNRYFGGQWDLIGESKEKLNDFVNFGYMLGG